MLEHKKPWQPLTVEEVTSLFTAAPFPVWIAGGIALELALGRPVRDNHADIDVVILRRNHLEARAWLARWDCWAADPPGTLRQWPVGQSLSDSVHDIWCRRSARDHWALQLMVDESDGQENWVSRRNPDVHATLSDITWKTGAGVVYLAPHIQLYYKAKKPRDKDEIDFGAVLESKVEFDVDWLRNAITRTYGVTHPWLKRLVEHR